MPRPPGDSRLRRVLRAFGAVCLAAAVGVAGALVWLLWGTGISTSHAQHQLRQALAPELHPRITCPPPGPGTVRVPGQGVAIIVIPRMHLNMVVVKGTDTASLERGPGMYPGSAEPWAAHGRVAIAGHRTTYLHPFWSLNLLRRGDLIELLTPYGTYKYRVTASFAVNPGDTHVLAQTAAPTLVLTTCNPRFSASQRLVVTADRLPVEGGCR